LDWWGGDWLAWEKLMLAAIGHWLTLILVAFGQKRALGFVTLWTTAAAQKEAAVQGEHVISDNYQPQLSHLVAADRKLICVHIEEFTF
jgi:hypothetical protein